jgi:hypothetical protein
LLRPDPCSQSTTRMRKIKIDIWDHIVFCVYLFVHLYVERFDRAFEFHKTCLLDETILTAHFNDPSHQ